MLCYDRAVIVELLVKAGCPLCEHMREELEEMREVVGFTLRLVDIATDPSLVARYRFDVPVVRVEGRELARHRIEDPGEFERNLQRLAAQHRGHE